MAMASDQDLQRLLDELGRLPGIGPKSAQRIAYHLLEADAEEAGVTTKQEAGDMLDAIFGGHRFLDDSGDGA